MRLAPQPEPVADVAYLDGHERVFRSPAYGSLVSMPTNDSFETIGRVGGYEIVDTIARGGFAVVFRARQPALNRLIALKRLELQNELPSVRERFVREARLASGMEHPNIVSVFDFFEHERVPYMAMEYLSKGSLRPWVGRLTEPQALGVLDGVLAGIAHAQEHGLAHRDLKPENLLLAKNGTVKVADFGIAKAYSHLTQKLTVTGMAVGTPTYMAPEQAMAEGVIGPATDLYALGVIAYELLSGKPPFRGDPARLLYLHVYERAPALAGVDPRLAEWVARLLEKDPALRPASAAEARRELEQLAVTLHGPLWRAEAGFGTATRQHDSLPADIPAVYQTVGGITATTTANGNGALTEMPKLAPDSADIEPVRV